MPDHIDFCAAAIGRLAFNGKSPGRLSRNAARFHASLPGSYKQNPRLQSRISEVAQKLGCSKRPVIVCVTDIVRESTPILAADLANLFHQITEGAGLFYLLPGPNAFGAGLLSPVRDQSSVMETIETGKVKALVLVEQDLFGLFPDHQRIEQAIKGVECLIVLDYLPSPSAMRAHVVLPTATLFERTASSFVNQEGRCQKALPIHRGGIPISQISGGDHPPRTFENHFPGGDPKAAHEVLAELYSAISEEDDGALLKGLWDWLAEEHPVFKASLSSPHGDRFVPPEISKSNFSFSKIGDLGPRKRWMGLVLTDWTFGTEELSTYSRFAREGETAPRLFLHPDDAARLGLAQGEEVVLHLEGGEVVLELCVESNMATGVIIVPRHRQVSWQKLKQWPTMVSDQQIHKR